MARISIFKRIKPSVVVLNTRQEFQDKYGKPAPDFDWAQPVKVWADTDPKILEDMNLEVAYTVIQNDSNGMPVYDSNSTVATKTIHMFPEAASDFNFLPVPLPPDSALTPKMRLMIQRTTPYPLELQPGETLKMSHTIGGSAEVDDGLSDAQEHSGGLTAQEHAVLYQTAATVARIESMLKSFPPPSQK